MSRDRIPVVALTGGPCSGKSTVMNIVRQRLAELGIHVITVAEAATELITSGFIPESPELRGFHFQHELLRHTIAREDAWIRLAGKLSAPRVVVLCDRGAMDGAAYITHAQFELLLGALELRRTDLRDARYDLVVFLESLAVDMPELYTLANNPARSESVELARTVNSRTLEAWTGCPHLVQVGNAGGIEYKVGQTVAAVCRVLGIPAPVEIERKYLISKLDVTQMPQPRQAVEIEQFYLLNDEPGVEERVRSRSQGGGTVYYHTRKQDVSSGVRIEDEVQVTPSEFYRLLRRADPALGRIAKTRHCFPYQNQYLELDVFPNGLVLLEVELTEETDSVTLPLFLEQFATDVTDDPAYRNRAIAERQAAA